MHAVRQNETMGPAFQLSFRNGILLQDNYRCSPRHVIPEKVVFLPLDVDNLLEESLLLVYGFRSAMSRPEGPEHIMQGITDPSSRKRGGALPAQDPIPLKDALLGGDLFGCQHFFFLKEPGEDEISPLPIEAVHIDGSDCSMVHCQVDRKETDQR